MKSGEDLFKVTKWLMLAAGTWTQQLIGVTNSWQKFYKIYSVGIQVVYLSAAVSVSVNFYNLWGVDTDKAIECVSILTMLLLLIIKIFLCQTKKMRALLAKAIADINAIFLNGDKSIKNKISSYSKTTNILNTFVAMYTFSVGMNLNVINFLEYYEYMQNHSNSTENLDKPYWEIYWFPFDTNKYYGAVFFYEVTTVLLTDLFHAANQAFLNSVITQLSVQLRILQYYFRNFTLNISTREKLSKQLALTRLKELVQKHQELIRYCEDLNIALKFPILIEYVVSSLMLASVLVQIIDGEKVSFYAQYFLILAFQWILLSWNCNEIRIQSEELSYALYESLWYEQNKSSKQILFIMVLRCRVPLSLKIGPFGPLTNDDALSRLKLAYSYLSIIS